MILNDHFLTEKNYTYIARRMRPETQASKQGYDMLRTITPERNTRGIKSLCVHQG